jgi:hypothetical protein
MAKANSDRYPDRDPREETMMKTTSGLDHRREFAAAWADPGNTRFELPPADINKLLADRYTISSPVAFTRDMLWDVELRKARQPDRYIPGVVRVGSARTWDQRNLATSTESFARASQQRLWPHPDEYGLVLEQTHLDHQAQKATFIGTAELAGPDGEPLHATARSRRALGRRHAWTARQPVAHRPPDPPTRSRT